MSGLVKSYLWMCLGKKRTSSVTLYPQRRMWKVSFESLKQKMYRLSEDDSCHKLGYLDIWFQISILKPDFRSGGCCKQSYHEREWTSHRKQKSSRTPTFIVSALSYSLVANISCCAHEMLYIFKCHLRRKINPPRMLGPTGWNLRLFPL